MKIFDLAIIIVNYKTTDLLKNCLTSIYKHTKNITFEVIVVDNNSDENTELDLLETKFNNLKLVLNKENVGFSKANNTGIKHSKGEYILLLNNDTEVLYNIFPDFIQTLENDKSIGVLGCKLLNPDKTLQLSAWKFPNIFTEYIQRIIIYRFLNHLGYKRFLLRKFKKKEVGLIEVDWVSGACIMFRKQLIEEVGFLDETYFMYFEDVDFCKRVKQKGYKVCYSLLNEIIHIEGQSRKERITHTYYYAQKSRFLYYIKFRPTWENRLLKKLLTLLYVIKIIWYKCRAYFSPKQYDQWIIVYTKLINYIKALN